MKFQDCVSKITVVSNDTNSSRVKGELVKYLAENCEGADIVASTSVVNFGKGKFVSLKNLRARVRNSVPKILFTAERYKRLLRVSPKNNIERYEPRELANMFNRRLFDVEIQVI